MSRIDDLIREFCPNGVEYQTIEDLCFVTRGKVISKQYLNEHSGIYPVYSSQTQDNGVLGYIDSYEYEGEYLTWTTDGANAGTIFRRSGKFNITNVCGLLEVTSTNCVTDFLYYWLQKTMKKYVTSGMGNPKLMSNVVKKILIPVPPLVVQREVVRVLDCFAELEAELEARQAQYAYYRDKLLDFTERAFRRKSPLGNTRGSVQYVQWFICQKEPSR